ncbi:hypothetical protein RUM43_006685 [Polyplax serrata]|uniref:Uncharacterized protein n=1 Tax=Polyplax serrata TaxID=468196 RepID=A0AAN8NYJ4_POLSC
MRLAFVYKVDPTSPSLQSQQPHLRQSSCQNKSMALRRKRSVILLPQPAHSRGPELGVACATVVPKVVLPAPDDRMLLSPRPVSVKTECDVK